MTASSVCRLPTRVSLQITCQKVCSSRNWTGRYLANLYSFCSTKVEFLCDLTRFLKISRGFIVSCLEGACDKLGFVLPILPVRLFPNAVQKIPEISEHPILHSSIIKFLLRLVYTPQMRIITPHFLCATFTSNNNSRMKCKVICCCNTYYVISYVILHVSLKLSMPRYNEVTQNMTSDMSCTVPAN